MSKQSHIYLHKGSSDKIHKFKQRKNGKSSCCHLESEKNKYHLVRFGGIVKSGDGNLSYIVSTAAFNEMT